MAIENTSAVRDSAGDPCPSGVISLAVSQNVSFSSQDMVALCSHLQCPGIEAKLWDILAAQLSHLLQFNVIFLERCGSLLQSGEKKSSKLSTYVFLLPALGPLACDSTRCLQSKTRSAYS